MSDIADVDELVDGILPKILQHPDLKRNFFPWHKPRKQYIRDKQWGENINVLIDELDLSSRPFRYVSLPGNDFLDIRAVQKICEAKQKELRFLGFDTSATLDSLSDPAFVDVIGLPFVSKGSRRIQDHFQNVRDIDSMAYKYINEIDHFDVLNLDLCDSLAHPKYKKSPSTISYYDAIMSLLQRQVNKRSESWVMFLTTRSSFSTTLRPDIEKYMTCIEQNQKNDSEFNKMFWEIMSFDETNNLLDLIYEQEKQDDFFNVFCLGIGKWLLQVMGSGLPKWDVEMLQSYHYRVHEKKDMVSFAFKFRRHNQSLRDNSRLINLPMPPMTSFNHSEFLSEVESGKNMIIATAIVEDLDHILTQQPLLFKTLVDEKARLLSSAGYSSQAYYEQVKIWHPELYSLELNEHIG